MRFYQSFLRVGLTIALLLLAVTASEGHILIFKDGFTLHGRVKEPGSVIADPVTNEGVFVRHGVYVLDSDARVITFSHHQVPPEGVVDKDLYPEAETIKLERRLGRVGPSMYPILQIAKAPDWGGDWNRTLSMRVDFGRGNVGPLGVEQRIVQLTPRYFRADAKKYNWSSFYSINELERSAVRDLLLNYPERKANDILKDDTRWRTQIYHFFVQAGWLDLAEEELAGIEKDHPDQKDAVAKFRESLLKLQSLQLFEEIERAQAAGRHKWAQEQLERIPRAGLDDKLLASIREMRAAYETSNEKIARARRLLKDLPTALSGDRRALITKAASVISEDLHMDNISRLEAFLTQTPPTAGADVNPSGEQAADWLALAITGWLMGKDAAEAKIDTAERLWKGREFVLDYLATNDVTERERKLKTFQGARTEPLAPDEALQLLKHLAPIRPEAEAGTEPMRRVTEVPGVGRKGVEYVVQLPPEYHIGRSYPVLIALHAGGGDDAADMLKRMTGLAARHGYILAAPNWEVWGPRYEHSSEENARVADLVVDLRRRFQVDSDRVFLFGAGEGGSMAYDIGLAQPHLFAGVVPMSAAPMKHAARYWANAQNLPFYIIDGTNSGDIAKQNQDVFKKWVPLGFPGIYVQYKGRGAEWFGGELPLVFEWMDRKKDQFKRSAAYPELGRLGGSLNREFLSLRDTDNRFYWISSEGLLPNQSVDGRQWRNGVLGATLYARIQEANILVTARNFKRLTIWLTRDMLDFSKPVTVRVNGETRLNSHRVQPSLKTLLEDVFQRADRQRPYWAKLDLER